MKSFFGRPTDSTRVELIDDRDARIDWLRGAAAVLVVIFHLFEPVDWSTTPGLFWLTPVIKWFWLGVPVFFVLSGRCVGQAWLREQPAKQFLLRRARRIYPPYLASLLLVFAAIVIRKIAVGSNDVAVLPLNLTSIVATLLLATDPATSVPTTNWVYWTLTYEVVFYLVLGLLLFVSARRLRLFVWLGMNAVFAGLHLTGFAAKATPVFFLDNWPIFALGVGLAMLASGEKTARASLIITAIHLTCIAAMGLGNASYVVALLTAAVLLIPESILHVSSKNPMARIGVFSYSLYLVHVPIGVWLLVMPLTSANGIIPTGIGFYAAPVIGLAGSLLAGFIFHRFAERPWMTPPVPISVRPARADVFASSR